MKRKVNIWPFGKGQPLGARTTHHRRVAAKPVSEKALAKQVKERESGRLERKLSDAQMEAKLRKHYARGGNLNEFLQANPGARKFMRNAGPMILQADYDAVADKTHVKTVDHEGLVRWSWIPGKITPESELIKRRKGAKGRLAIARGKRNPSAAAAEVYEEFHGRPSSEVVTISEKIHYHKNLAALGELRSLVVLARDGAKVTLSRFKKAILCTNEQKDQLFVRGGDQAVDVREFGIKTPHEVETLGKVVELAYFTRKDHLGDEGGTALYFHVAGETNENGKRKMAGWSPDLIYRVRDEALEFSGGSYTIRAEGVDK